MLGTVFIGRYKVIEELGRGGMGIVYRGEDPALDRPVAIKVLPPKMTSQKKAVKRFLREARVSARLDHPHIVKIYDIGEEEEIYHIVMEYVSGKTLRDIIEERESIGEIDIAEMARLFKQICDAIGYAHGLKIVHRDIKPENIMVTKEGSSRVMDFGLAVLEDRHSLTGVGVIMGTIAYFSPEQARGELADTRSDIYSMGVLFYEMLTNSLPFEATNPSEMIQKHLNSLPTPPSRKNPAIPEALENIIMRALRKLPEERYQDMAEMIAEMEQYMLGGRRAAVKSAPPSSETPPPAAAKPMAPVREPQEAKHPMAQTGAAAPRESQEAPPVRPVMPREMPVTVRPDIPEQSSPLRDLRNLFQARPVEPQELEDSGDEEYDEEGGFEYKEGATLPGNLIPPREADIPSPAKDFKPPVPFLNTPNSAPFASPQWRMEAQEETDQDRYQAFMDKLKRDASIRAHATEAYAAAPPTAVVCPKCGLENEGDRKYCTECGGLLAPSYFVASREATRHYDQGMIHFQEGDYARSLFEFQQALARDPDMMEARFNIARSYLEMDELEQALNAFRDFSALQPQNPQTFLYIADIYRKQDRKDLAIAEYIKAIKLDPNDPQVHCQLAFLYSQQGALPQAISEYRSAVAIDSDNIEAHKQLGFIMAGLEQYDDAIREFEWVIRLDPANHQAHKWLGNLYAKRKRYGQAERAFSTALSLNPTDAGLHAQLGTIYEKQNKEEMAFQTLQKAVTIDYGNVEAHTQLAEMYLKYNQPQMAVKELEAIATHHPNDVDVHQQLGEIYLTLNRFDEALEHFEKTVSLAPGSADLHNKLGKLYLKKDYNQLSLLEYQKAVSIEPFNPNYREELGMAYYCQNKNDMAIEELKKAVRLDSRNVDYYKALGVILEEEQRYDEALKHLEKAIEMDPRDAMTHGLMGKVYFSQGLTSMAIVEYQKGIELQPCNYLLFIYLARAYSKQQKVDLAINAFRMAIEFMPRHKGAEYNAVMGKAYVDLGKAYLEKGDLNLAREVLETAHRLTPENARISHYLGLIYMGNKDYRKALEFISQALNQEPNNAEIMADLGNLFSARGDTELAIKAYRRALEIAPDKLDIYEFLVHALSRAGRVAEASDIIRKARDMDRAHPDHYHWLMGGVFSQAKDYVHAIEEYKKALSCNDRNWRYYFDLACAYRSINQNGEALRHFEYAASVCRDKASLEQIGSEINKLKGR